MRLGYDLHHPSLTQNCFSWQYEYAAYYRQDLYGIILQMPQKFIVFINSSQLRLLGSSDQWKNQVPEISLN
jgi:hypothetical protein